MYRFIDLFCGVGGFRLALERQGLKCVFSSEIDHIAQQVYETNFGERPSGDITKISESTIPSHDILCAGFPCQSFSISGSQAGFTDTRGQLFFEIIRIAKYHRPSILLLENVKNIQQINGGLVIKAIEKAIDDLGYHLHLLQLNSSFFGIPQSRERVYFVAIRKDLHQYSFNPPIENRKKIYLKDILDNNIDDCSVILRDDIKIDVDERLVQHSLKPIRIGTVNKGGQGERIYSPKGHAITQSAFGGGVGAKTGLYNTPQGIRRLTINECKKVMGFPDEHKVSEGSQGSQQLGNAVIPQMIEYIYKGINI